MRTHHDGNSFATRVWCRMLGCLECGAESPGSAMACARCGTPVAAKYSAAPYALPGKRDYDTPPTETDRATFVADPVHRRRVLAGLAGAAVLLWAGPPAGRFLRRIHAPVRDHEGTELWSFGTPGSVAAGLVAVGNVVYTCDNNPNGGPSSHNVYALDAATGRAIG